MQKQKTANLTMPDTWYPTGLVLLTEIRTCKCGQVYHAPNPSLLVEYECGSRRVRRNYRPGQDEAASLPHSRIEVYSEVVACIACFPIGTSEAAQRFRDALQKGKREEKERLRKLKKELESGVTRITLEDI